jgi:hypothetical protein
MRVSKDDIICGVFAPVTRELMRAFCLGKPTEVAHDVLDVSVDETWERLCSFEAAGYVQRLSSDDDWWATTIKGSALAQARFQQSHQPRDSNSPARRGCRAGTHVQQ